MTTRLRTPRHQELIRTLKMARASVAMSQRELSKALGRSAGFMSKIEAGERRIEILELIEIAGACGVKASEWIAAIELVNDEEPITCLFIQLNAVLSKKTS